MKRPGYIARDPEKLREWQERSRRNSQLGRSPLPQGKGPRPTGRIKKNSGRAAANYARSFHSAARVLFVQSLPCCVCGREPTEDAPSQNAHVTIGGTGYRDDYDRVAPLCGPCHTAQEARSAAFERERGLPEGFLLACAAETEARWQALNP